MSLFNLLDTIIKKVNSSVKTEIQEFTDEEKKQVKENLGISENGVQSDYNQNDSTQPDYIKNRPFYLKNFEDVVWDGSTEGLVSIDIETLVGLTLHCYLVSDQIIKKEKLLGGKFTYNKNITKIIEDDPGIFYFTQNGSCADARVGRFFCVTEPNTEFDLTPSLGVKIVFATPGVWFTKAEYNGNIVEQAVSLTTTGDSKLLDTRCIPDIYVKKSEKAMPNGVATLDENGKVPTEQLPDNIGGIGGGSGGDVLWVTANFSLQSLKVTDLSHTSDEIRAALNSGKVVKVKNLYYFSNANNPDCAYSEIGFVSSNFIGYQIMIRANFGQGTNLYYFHVNIEKDNYIETTPYILSMTEMGR